MPNPNPTGTGGVSYKSDLVRRKWMVEGLIQNKAKSFWAPYTGATKDNIVMQVKNTSASDGHIVDFQMRGNLTGKAVKGKQQAVGTGEQKKIFSDSVTVERYRWVVDNGDKFDGKNIGDLSINEHADSREMLSDVWTRVSDQSIFDVAQQTTEFGIDLGNKFEFNDFANLEELVKTGRGFSKSPASIKQRAPLRPFRFKDGREMWLLVIDVSTKTKLLGNSATQSVLSQADIRGNENRLLKGIVGTLGSFVVVEAPLFFGTSDGPIVNDNGYYNFHNNSVNLAGLRQYVLKSTDNTKHWYGTSTYDTEVATTGNKIISRNIILGAGAMHFALGKMPDYKFESSDFDIKSESALEVWCGVKPAKLYAENKDYEALQYSGYNYGAIYVDLELKTI